MNKWKKRWIPIFMALMLILSGCGADVQAENEQKTESSYVLNTNTKKFHLPSCSSLNQMNESNKGEFTGTRDELIQQGYEPCKRCHP